MSWGFTPPNDASYKEGDKEMASVPEKPLEMRSYQTKAVREILEHTIVKGERVMFQLATGAGKTAIATRVIEQVLGNLDLTRGLDDNAPSEGVIFMCHRIELIAQAERTFREAGLPVHMSYDVSSSQPANKIYKRGHVNIQSAGKMGGQKSKSVPFKSFLVLDEAHHAPANSWKRILKQHQGQVLGLTATPYRLNPRQHFKDLFDYLITGESLGASAQDLVDEGYLIEPTVMVPRQTLRHLPSEVVAGDVSMGRLSKRLSLALTQIPVDEWFKRACEGRRRPLKSLFFAATQEIAVQQTKFLLDNGIRAGVLLSDDELASLQGLRSWQYDRETVIRDFESDVIEVIVNCNIVSEGFDVPAVQCVVVGRPTQSLAMFRQMIGRAMRPDKESRKKWAMVIDCGGSVMDESVGSPMVEPEWTLEARIDTPATMPGLMKTCPTCQTLNWGATQNCTTCKSPFGRICKRCNIWRSWKDYKTYGRRTDDDECFLCTEEMREIARQDALTRIRRNYILAQPSRLSRLFLYPRNVHAVNERIWNHKLEAHGIYVIDSSIETAPRNVIAKKITAGQVIDEVHVSPETRKVLERQPPEPSEAQHNLPMVALGDSNGQYAVLDLFKARYDTMCNDCHHVHKLTTKRHSCAVKDREEREKMLPAELAREIFPSMNGYAHPLGCTMWQNALPMMDTLALMGKYDREPMKPAPQEEVVEQLAWQLF